MKAATKTATTADDVFGGATIDDVLRSRHLTQSAGYCDATYRENWTLKSSTEHVRALQLSAGSDPTSATMETRWALEMEMMCEGGTVPFSVSLCANVAHLRTNGQWDKEHQVLCLNIDAEEFEFFYAALTRQYERYVAARDK